jgi:hypothetical protein
MLVTTHSIHFSSWKADGRARLDSKQKVTGTHSRTPTMTATTTKHFELALLHSNDCLDLKRYITFIPFVR